MTEGFAHKDRIRGLSLSVNGRSWVRWVGRGQCMVVCLVMRNLARVNDMAVVREMPVCRTSCEVAFFRRIEKISLRFSYSCFSAADGFLFLRVFPGQVDRHCGPDRQM